MKALPLLAVITIAGCGLMVGNDEPVQTLQEAGYSNINCYDSHWIFPTFYGCGERDHIAFECTATNPAGGHVDVTVCSSATFKGSTIRH
jgi:hypothetical protein